MEKAKQRTRDIQFYSNKNEQMICVHSQRARDYAKYLETQDSVVGYETNVSLNLEQYSHINPVDIRPDYLQIQWVSDFCLKYQDGRIGIRELISEEMLRKRAAVEKLELSRRYWFALDVQEWKVILVSTTHNKGDEE